MKPSELAKLSGCKPQQVFNYISQGRIEAYRNEEGKWAIDDEVAREWATKHKAKREEREQKRKDMIQAQLRGEAWVAKPTGRSDGSRSSRQASASD